MGYISTQHHDHARIKKNTPMEKYSIKLIAPSNVPEILKTQMHYKWNNKLCLDHSSRYVRQLLGVKVANIYIPFNNESQFTSSY